MALGNQVFSDRVTVTYTRDDFNLAAYAVAAPVHPAMLGAERALTADEMLDWFASASGPGVARFVYNDAVAAAAWAIGDIIGRLARTTEPAAGPEPSFSGILAPLSAPRMRLLGVAQHAIPSGSYGWVLKQGIGEVLADTGGVTAANALIVGNAVTGRADNLAAAIDGQAFGYAIETVAATALATCMIDIP